MYGKSTGYVWTTYPVGETLCDRAFQTFCGKCWYNLIPRPPCQEPRPLDGWGMDNHPLNPENPWSLNINLGSARSV